MTNEDPDFLISRIPADVERPDKIIAGLTARQVLILAVTGLLAAWAYILADGHVPIPILAVVVFPLVAVGCTLALGRRDGVGLDRLVVFALEHLRRPKTLVAAPEGIVAPPSWCRMRGRLPGPLRLPVRAVRQDGVMELVDGGTAVIVRAGTVPFGLRTTAEQASLVAFFGRWLNSLDAPVQILVQARTADLSGLIAGVEDAAGELPHPALERAALGHAAFLEDLSASRDLLTRHALIVIREGSPTGAPARRGKARQAGAAMVIRRAEEALRFLTGLGINAELLDAEACARVLLEALSPGEVRTTEFTGVDEVVTTAPERSGS